MAGSINCLPLWVRHHHIPPPSGPNTSVRCEIKSNRPYCEVLRQCIQSSLDGEGTCHERSPSQCPSSSWSLTLFLH